MEFVAKFNSILVHPVREHVNAHFQNKDPFTIVTTTLLTLIAIAIGRKLLTTKGLRRVQGGGKKNQKIKKSKKSKKNQKKKNQKIDTKYS